jgi:hypothetical protein
MDTITEISTTGQKSGGRRITQRRDAAGAREAALERLATAQAIADAVDSYHGAADRIDAATAELASASEARLEAIRRLRQCKLTISEIGDLTGLSQSRVQALSREG